MSLQWCREHSEIELTEDGPKLSGMRTFLARVTERTDGRPEIVGSLPAPFSTYQGMYLTQRTFRRVGKGYKLWKVGLKYETDVPQSQVDAYNNPNPLNRPCVIDLVTLREQVAVTKGRDGKPIVNVLGRPYDPPLMKWRTRLRLECEKNVLSYPSWFFSLADRINQDPITIRGQVFDEKTLMFCTDRIPDKIREQEHEYFKVAFALEWTPEGWDPEVLQADTVAINATGGIGPIYEDGSPVATPRKLSSLGTVIVSDDPDEAFFEREEIQDLGSFGVLSTVLS